MNRIAQAVLMTIILSAGLLSPAGASAQGEFRGFSEAELDQMLAPIALYPDTVLSHVLIAATYPIEVVRAARWTRENAHLSGEQAVNAVIGQDWDPSVMALVAFPEVLRRMDADLDWTQRLGDAFLIQEAEVLDSIQRLRAQAYSAGHLRSTEQVQVIREREVIYIEPPRRQVVFVPVYDTRVVFGSWAWVHHPPVFWHPPPRHRSRLVVYWGPAFHVPPAFFFSSFHWSHRHVVVVHHHHHFFRSHHPHHRRTVHHHHHHHYRGRDLARHDEAQRWRHDPGHRRGVAYHPAVDERHRQLEQRAAPVAGAPSAPSFRVADTRTDQREWAAARRAEARVPGVDAAAARSTSPAASGSTRTAAAARGTETRPPATRSAAEVERRIQDRSAMPRQGTSGTRSPEVAGTRTVHGRTPSAGRPAEALRAPPVTERQAQQRPASTARSAAAPAPRVTTPSAGPRPSDPRSAPSRAVPPSPANVQPAPRTQSPAAAARQPQVAPSRSASPPPRSAPQPARTAPQRQSGASPATAPARQAPRAAPERRPSRQID